MIKIAVGSVICIVIAVFVVKSLFVVVEDFECYGFDCIAEDFKLVFIDFGLLLIFIHVFKIIFLC